MWRRQIPGQSKVTLPKAESETTGRSKIKQMAGEGEGEMKVSLKIRMKIPRQKEEKIVMLR